MDIDDESTSYKDGVKPEFLVFITEFHACKISRTDDQLEDIPEWARSRKIVNHVQIFVFNIIKVLLILSKNVEARTKCENINQYDEEEIFDIYEDL